mmetsp:Transcript_12451/g.28703  ORF Transcript_12451/g.28703 Transcript_12451/m.28703 type:complete len:109 (-) Transcript_12451:709-1035(-)
MHAHLRFRCCSPLLPHSVVCVDTSDIDVSPLPSLGCMHTELQELSPGLLLEHKLGAELIHELGADGHRYPSIVFALWTVRLTSSAQVGIFFGLSFLKAFAAQAVATRR